MTHVSEAAATEPAATEPKPVGAPRVSRRRAAATVVLALTGAGVVAGALWAWLAPPVQGAIGLTKAGERVHGYVGNASDQLFLGAFLLPGFVAVVAIVAAVLTWRWRVHRGPLLVAALSVGAVAATGAAAGVGAALARWRYGAVDLASAPVSPEHRIFYVTEAPSVFFGHTPWQIAVTIVFPAGLAALVYALFALSTLRDDLGAWPEVTGPAPTFTGPAPTVTGPVPTGADAPPVDPSSPSR